MKEGKIYSWGNARRYHAYSDFIRSRFGSRVQKLTIDAGFTCPNRDGTLGRGGCTYCNNDAFNPSYCEPEKSITRQISEGIEFHRGRYNRATSYLAYFQAYSNTYDDVEVLKSRYDEALKSENVIGLVIGTRPDCLDNSVLDYLSELNGKTFLTIEIGIESCYDKTLLEINRGHDFSTTVRALEEIRKRGIRSGGHLIFGLPGESREDILREADILSGLPVDQLKFHQLQIVDGTVMAARYRKDPAYFKDFELNEYLELVAAFLERLDPGIVIERIAGETVPRFNLRKSWGMRYDQVLNRFESLLEQNDSWQGKFYVAKP